MREKKKKTNLKFNSSTKSNIEEKVKQLVEVININNNKALVVTMDSRRIS